MSGRATGSVRAGTLSEGIDEIWVEVGRFRVLSDAEQHALVLVASGVVSRLVPHAAEIVLLVAAPDAMRARSEIAAYARENSPRPPSRPALRPFRDGIDGALIYCAVLAFIQAAAERGAFSYDWLALGNAQAGLIRSGEWWRAVTALGLHADLEHLAGNLALGGVLGILLAQLLGTGLAWLAILVCGGIGNAITAVLYPAGHAAIGASTAVFAALGLLAALAWRERVREWWGLRKWLPIAAAIMLLSLLGTAGERTDVGAHVAGLLTGCAAGAALFFAGPRLPRGRTAQRVYGAAALALFAGSWLAAFASG